MSEYDWKVGALYEIAMNDKILIHCPSNVGKTWLCYKYISLILNEYRDKNIVYVTKNRAKSTMLDILNMEDLTEGVFLRVNTYTLTTRKHTNLVISSPNGAFFRGMHVDFLIMDDFGDYDLDILKDILPCIQNSSKIVGISANTGTESFNYVFEQNPLKCARMKI